MKRFTRNKENFECEHCHIAIQGNGYTNHCPECLWSKHVDKDPGDRAEECGGAMEPVAIEQKKGGQVLIHRCKQCKVERRNKVAENDNFQAILAVIKGNKEE